MLREKQGVFPRLGDGFPQVLGSNAPWVVDGGGRSVKVGSSSSSWATVLVDIVDDAGAPSENQNICLEWAWLGSAWSRPRPSLGRFGWALLRLDPIG